MLQLMGWLATAIFSASYFFRGPATLRRIQAAAACLWIVYGVAIRAWPVSRSRAQNPGCATTQGNVGRTFRSFS